ncbi:hypothetical protein Bbelb_336260 [Branchiostoma belcheri]|nr:hypothetical protein Bbelb_336260 [Branchiostoma belcheri]
MPKGPNGVQLPQEVPHLHPTDVSDLRHPGYVLSCENGVGGLRTLVYQKCSTQGAVCVQKDGIADVVSKVTVGRCAGMLRQSAKITWKERRPWVNTFENCLTTSSM